LAFSIFIAVERFLCWLRSLWQATTMPRQVADAHRRFGLVDVLAAAHSSVDVHLESAG